MYSGAPAGHHDVMNVPDSPPAASPGCPDCGAPVGPHPRSCMRCGLALVGATAQRLWHIDSEIARLDHHRLRLLSERTAVLAALRRESAAAAAHAVAAAAPLPPPSTPRLPTPGPARGEVSRYSAQNVILGLGGLLVGISALVFAIWTWSDMGTGARASVLGLTTLAFAAAALPTHRRGLRATAETFGSLFAALLCIDALALWLLMSDRISSGPGYAAAALSVVGALLALYPLAVPLGSPRVLAALLVQPVPLLLLLSLPLPDRATWVPAVLAATALAGAAAVRLLGPPRRGVPLRTLYTAAVTLWLVSTGTAVLLVLVVQDPVEPQRWWALAAALLVSGATGLLLSRTPVPFGGGTGPAGAPAVLGLMSLGTVALAAGPARLPVLPRLPTALWSGDPATTALPAVQVLGFGDMPQMLLHLGAVLTGAVLATGVTVLLRRDLLLPLLALILPPVLLALPLLLGLAHAGAVVWALAVGAAMLSASALTGTRPHAWVWTVTGTLTVVTGLLWAFPVRVVGLSALVAVGATTLGVLLLYRRAVLRAPLPPAAARLHPAPQAPHMHPAPPVRGRLSMPGAPPRPAPVPGGALYWAGLVLLSVSLSSGMLLLPALVALGPDARAPWWLLAASALLSGANCLLLGRLSSPSPAARGADSGSRGTFTAVGLLLLATAPLLIGGGGLPPAWPHAPWQAPPSAMADPAPRVLGTAALGGAEALVTALGLVAAGVLAVVLAALLDRSRTRIAAVVTAPPALVPLPLVLGLPYAAAVGWTMLVGAGLLLGVSAARGRAAWVQTVAGLLTLGLGLLWSTAEQHTTLSALALTALASLTGALVLRRSAPAGREGGSENPRAAALTAVLVPLGAVAVSAVVAWGASLVSGQSGQTVWWLLALAVLLAGATGPVLGDRRVLGTPVAAVLGLLALGSAPLITSLPSLPALAAFSMSYPVAGAEPGDLLEPAHAFLGVAAAPNGAAAAALAAGILLAGLGAVAAVAATAREHTARAAALTAPPTLVALPVVAGAPFLAALVWVLAVGTALVLWSALLHERRAAWLPGLTGLLTLAQGLGWSLAEQNATVGALMLTAVVGAVAAALARTPMAAVAATAVATAATGGFALALPLALGVPGEYAALMPIALAAGTAAVAPRLRSPLLEAAEVPATLWAVAALATAVLVGTRAEVVALALAATGVIALATATRPGRRWSAAVGGVLMLGALWTALAAWNVRVPEAYTVVPALAALAVGWEWSRKAERPPSSWAAYAGGLALLLVPSTVLLLGGEDMAWRAPLLLAAAAGTAVWGLRARLQAVLVLSGAVLVLASVRAFGPPLWDLTRLLPNWVPFAVTGALLLLVGARYEANLARLRRLGHLLGQMR